MTLLGISADDAASHVAFIQKYDLPFSLLTDADRSMMAEYGAYGEKTMYGKTSVGVIRSSVLIGADGTVLKHWKKVGDAAKHPEQALKIINEEC